MKRLNYQFLFAVLIGLLIPIGSIAQLEYIQVGSTTRNMIVEAPSGIEQNRPLIINMHGMNQDAAYQKSMANWGPIAAAERFVVVYPNGVNKSWDLYGTSDTDFILAIIDEMYSRYSIDRDRVYLSGFSMGGMMTYYAATKIADKIAAFAPVSGYLMGGPNTNSSRPIPIIHTHGTADDVVPFSGVQTCLDAWITRNGCPSTAQVTDPYPSSNPNSTAKKSYWGPGDDGVEIVLMTLEGKGHWWSMDAANSISTSQEIWDFCKNFSLSGENGNIIQENKTGFCGVDGTVDNNNSGYTGSGFANTDNAIGNGIDWKVYFTSSGTQTFTFRYAGTDDRPANLIVNGSIVESNFNFQSTGSWTIWNTVTINANTDSGIADVRLEATGSNGLPNIDYMEIAGGSAAACGFSEGTFNIINRNSGQYLDCYNSGTTDGTNVVQWPGTGSSNQQWEITAVGDNYYRISPVHAPSEALDVTDYSSSDGANVQLWGYWGGECQQWRFIDVGDGYYQIEARHSGQLLEVVSASTDNGANVQQWPANGHICQHWSLQQLKSASGSIDLERKAKPASSTEIQVYPNPTDGNFTIQIPQEKEEEEEEVEISIFDLQGKSVYTNSLKYQTGITISTTLTKGLYILKVSYGNSKYMYKLKVE
jgi:poly(3-hydroxybutyrate) depolymerase